MNKHHQRKAAVSSSSSHNLTKQSRAKEPFGGRFLLRSPRQWHYQTVNTHGLLSKHLRRIFNSCVGPHTHTHTHSCEEAINSVSRLLYDFTRPNRLLTFALCCMSEKRKYLWTVKLCKIIHYKYKHFERRDTSTSVLTNEVNLGRGYLFNKREERSGNLFENISAEARNYTINMILSKWHDQHAQC